jgi:hypothetical protein
MDEMSKHIRDLLLQFFPDRSRLEWEDFFSEGIKKIFYPGHKELVLRCFDMISRPWPDISWDPLEVPDEFEAIPISGCILVFRLNQKGFTHVFPAILADIAEGGFSSEGGGLATFSYTELDLNRLHEDWKVQFYLSLSDDIKKLIEHILMKGADYDIADGWRAMRYFSPTVTVGGRRDRLGQIGDEDA